jgi:hypothetical protein
MSRTLPLELGDPSVELLLPVGLVQRAFRLYEPRSETA